jgi:hypothetical protein
VLANLNIGQKTSGVSLLTELQTDGHGRLEFDGLV